MKAVVWHGKHDVRVDEVPDPKIEEPTDAVVRITSTAICGSDLHLYSKLGLAMKKGDIIGHEPMGIVEEVGPDVSHIAGGDRVVIPFNVACGRCFMCRRGLQSQCETTQNRRWGKGGSLFGYTHLYGGVAGGQAEYLRVPHAHYGPIKVPEGPPDVRFLFLSDVLPTAWQAVEYADVPDDGTVVVWGLGPIGQLSARVARRRGAGRVIGVDSVAERRAMAERWGVETIDAQDGDPVEAVRERTDGRGADAGIDAVGMEAEGSLLEPVLQGAKVVPDRLHALKQTMGAVRRGATVSVSGVYTAWFPKFPLGQLFDRQISIRMGQANVRRWVDEIMPLLGDDDPLGTDDLATHTVPLGEAPKMYERFQKKRDGTIKVVLRP
ncbi:MAG TPA: zinc-dependent alcohol dehydrogenase [Actinomycetota bacterium]|nr:zinc-dependent alcohol dehydrogenase [Actinomycetota bacterium]